jgi:hypothetical protein
MSDDQTVASPDREHLAREAYTLADLHREGALTRNEALRELEVRCPGFSQAEYAEAFARGLFESR